MAADRRPMPCPAIQYAEKKKNDPPTPWPPGSVPCRAVPDRKRRHACSCCPSVPCYAADRPAEFCVPYPYQKKTKINKQKKGMGKGKKPLRCCAFPSPSRPTEAKKKGSCRRCQTASHMTMHSLSGTPPSLASLASLGSLGSFFALRVLLLPLPPWLLDFDRSFL